MVQQRFLSSKTGFTLFELLVSISIIGILIALATVSFTAAQVGARDSRRRSDMTSLRNAMEQYYAVNTEYPVACSGLATDLAPYLPGGIPNDPRNVDPYVYSDSQSCTDTDYCFCAQLERTGTGNYSDSGCANPGAGDYYCVESLQ